MSPITGQRACGERGLESVKLLILLTLEGELFLDQIRAKYALGQH